MNDPKVLLARDSDKYHIKVKGRANFECAPPLRTLAKTIESENMKAIDIDLSDCVGMDSTFMGILAMIAMKAKNKSIPVFIVNADDGNKKLLNGLGLAKLFVYQTCDQAEAIKKWTATRSNADRTENAKTVLDAHETLIKVDDENLKRFKNVVDFVKKDMESKE